MFLVIRINYVYPNDNIFILVCDVLLSYSPCDSLFGTWFLTSLFWPSLSSDKYIIHEVLRGSGKSVPFLGLLGEVDKDIRDFQDKATQLYPVY